MWSLPFYLPFCLPYFTVPVAVLDCRSLYRSVTVPNSWSRILPFLLSVPMTVLCRSFNRSFSVFSRSRNRSFCRYNSWSRILPFLITVLNTVLITVLITVPFTVHTRDPRKLPFSIVHTYLHRSKPFIAVLNRAYLQHFITSIQLMGIASNLNVHSKPLFCGRPCNTELESIWTDAVPPMLYLCCLVAVMISHYRTTPSPRRWTRRRPRLIQSCLCISSAWCLVAAQ